MFTTEHLIWIGICAAFVLFMNLICRRLRLSLRVVSRIMAGICIVSESSKIMSSMLENQSGGRYLDPLALPFHLCSLMLFGVLFIAFGKDGKAKQIVIDFIAVAGTIGSVCAILIPSNGTAFNALDSYQCFVYHGALLWFSIYLIASGHARFGARVYLRNLCMLLSLVLLALYANSVLAAYDANFMFLTQPPMENLPYLNLNHGWYAYFFRLLALGFSLFTLFQLPFMLHRRRKRDA